MNWALWNQDLENKLETDSREIVKFKNPNNLRNSLFNIVSGITKLKCVCERFTSIFPKNWGYDGGCGGSHEELSWCIFQHYRYHI